MEGEMEGEMGARNESCRNAVTRTESHPDRDGKQFYFLTLEVGVR